MQIDVEKMKQYIEDNQQGVLTTEQIQKEIFSIRLEILKEAKQELSRAFKKQDSTMVAAIAEILGNY